MHGHPVPCCQIPQKLFQDQLHSSMCFENVRTFHTCKGPSDLKASVNLSILRMERDDFGRTRRDRNRHHVVHLDIPEPVGQPTHTHTHKKPAKCRSTRQGRLVVSSAIKRWMTRATQPLGVVVVPQESQADTVSAYLFCSLLRRDACQSCAPPLADAQAQACPHRLLTLALATPSPELR